MKIDDAGKIILLYNIENYDAAAKIGILYNNNLSNGVQGVQTRLKRKDRFESK